MTTRRRRFGIAFASLMIGSFGGCSSASTTSVAADASATDAAPEAAPDASPADSASSSADAASPVKERPSPECHDLLQRAELVAIEPNPARTPPPRPVASIAPGFYVLTSSIEHGTTGPIDFPKTRTTAYVSPTRFYLLIEGEPPQPRVAATFDWSIQDGTLERTLVCSSVPGSGKTSSQRVDASENGFTIYTTGTSTVNGYIANRYVRVD